MSNLEPAAFNYLQLRTRDQEGLERARLQLSQSSPLSAAVNKCIELLPNAKKETQQAVVVSLDSALRLSSGFASRGGVADAATLMCNVCPDAFVFPGLNGMANPSVRLMQAFYYAMEKDRGPSREKYTHAVGTIAAFCPGRSVRGLAIRACDRYRASVGNNNDPASRRAAAGALRAIVVRATNKLEEDNNSSVRKTVLPVAFLGQKDEETKTAALMKEVWQEGGSAVQISTSNDFGTRVEEALLPELVTECVRALEDVSWSRRIAGAKSLSELCALDVLSPLRVSGAADYAHSPKALLRAKRRAQYCNVAIGACVRLLKKPRLWTGKSTVVSETVRLVSSWTPLVNKEESTAMLGFDESDISCDWQVLSFESTIDILEGDGTFDDNLMHEETSIEEGLAPQNEEVPDDETDDNKVDFEAMDVDVPPEQSEKKPHEMSRIWSTLAFPGFCRFLVEEALPSSPSASLILSEEFLPYRTSCLRGFRDLLKGLPDSGDPIRKLIFECVKDKLMHSLSSGDPKKTPPVLVAASMECIAACLWNMFPRDESEKLSALLRIKGGTGQPAWTVREAAALSLSQLASSCDEAFLRKPSAISEMMAAASWACQDRKFFRVRVAGLLLVQALIERSGTATNRAELALESLLPYKEDFQKLLRKALSDSEPRVTSISSDIIVKMSWWP